MKIRKLAYMVLFVIVCILVPVCGIVYFLPDRIMFHNVHCRESREALQGMQGYSEVAFTAENGRTYHGVLRRAGEEKSPLVIYFGGNAEVSYRHMLMRENRDQWRHFEGYHYLFVDYPGYGLNDGRPHYLNMYEHALAVFDYAAVLPEVDSDRVVIMAFSIGTGGAVHLAASRPVAGLILATPYANGYDLYNNVIPVFYGPMRLLARQKFPNDEFAPNVSCPVLVIASQNDEMVPFASSERLVGLFQGDVDFIELESERHNSVFDAEGVFDAVQGFLRLVLDGG